MPESEAEHVKRVMEVLKVGTILISAEGDPDKRIYVDGELVFSGEDLTDLAALRLWDSKLFIHCNTSLESDWEWECSSFDGDYLPESMIEEALI
jgi:hypothetical protein